MTRVCMIAVLLCFALASVAVAAEFRDYPQYRYASGMPGGSNGVTPDGHIGFDGVFQLNIPVGYTPGWGNFMVTVASAAINGGFPDGYSGHDNNGTLTAGFGLFNRPRVWYSEMGTGKGEKSLESVQNLQIEVIPESEHWPGISVGVIDMFDRRPASLDDPYGDGGQSFYAVATREGGTADRPIYYTLGFGNARFHNRPFGGISYQAADRLQTFVEYDGWVGNVGAAYDVVRSREWHGIFCFSLVDFDRIDLSFSLTKTDF